MPKCWQTVAKICFFFVFFGSSPLKISKFLLLDYVSGKKKSDYFD